MPVEIFHWFLFVFNPLILAKGKAPTHLGSAPLLDEIRLIPSLGQAHPLRAR